MQGFNKYYPPDYDPSKNSSLNSYRGVHALGDRARKLNQGVLITRFELPFNIWCGGCDAHIGMGVRYNAEKKKVGMYYSTPIYAFRCKCHLCSHWFEIRTDPQNTRYVVHEGARQKNEEWDPSADGNGGFAPIEMDATKHPLDAFQSLEKKEADKRVAMGQKERLSRLESLNEGTWEDPYLLNVKLRKAFREVKKESIEKDGEDEEVRERFGLRDDLKLEGKRERWEKRVGVEFEGEREEEEEERKRSEQRDREDGAMWERLREERERNRVVEMELGTGRNFADVTRIAKRKLSSSTSTAEFPPAKRRLSASSSSSRSTTANQTLDDASLLKQHLPHQSMSMVKAKKEKAPSTGALDVLEKRRKMKKDQSVNELKQRLIKNTQRRNNAFGGFGAG
ncbi:DUF572-domain-containing protein [Atractiella rhizophila]|nr:DUF572-domain-containing protein [Atractiella rhizophila]